jgi:hypothetical protein
VVPDPTTTAAIEELRADLNVARLLAILGLSLAFLAIGGGLIFLGAAWQPHRRAVSQTLERSLPDALRAQAGEVTALSRRLDEARAQWQAEREALRRGQELLASHGGPRPADLDRDELARLRADLEALRRDLGPGARGG